MNLEGSLLMDARTFLDGTTETVRPDIYQLLFVQGVGTLTWVPSYNGHIAAYRYLSGSGEVNFNRGNAGSVTALSAGIYDGRLLDCIAGLMTELWIKFFAGETINIAFQGAASVALYVTHEI